MYCICCRLVINKCKGILVIATEARKGNFGERMAWLQDDTKWGLHDWVDKQEIYTVYIKVLQHVSSTDYSYLVEATVELHLRQSGKKGEWKDIIISYTNQLCWCGHPTEWKLPEGVRCWRQDRYDCKQNYTVFHCPNSVTLTHCTSTWRAHTALRNTFQHTWAAILPFPILRSLRTTKTSLNSPDPSARKPSYKKKQNINLCQCSIPVQYTEYSDQ